MTIFCVKCNRMVNKVLQSCYENEISVGSTRKDRLDIVVAPAIENLH